MVICRSVPWLEQYMFCCAYIKSMCRGWGWRLHVGATSVANKKRWMWTSHHCSPAHVSFLVRFYNSCLSVCHRLCPFTHLGDRTLSRHLRSLCQTSRVEWYIIVERQLFCQFTFLVLDLQCLNVLQVVHKDHLLYHKPLIQSKWMFGATPPWLDQVLTYMISFLAVTSCDIHHVTNRILLPVTRT